MKYLSVVIFFCKLFATTHILFKNAFFNKSQNSKYVKDF